MYLARIRLKKSDRDCRQWMTNPERIHGAVESCFKQKTPRERHLWRLDKFKDDMYLLILSEVFPDVTQLVSSYGETYDILSLEELPEQLAEPMLWRFRITVNPTHQQSGHRMHHVTAAQQTDWLLTKMQKCGCSVHPDWVRRTGYQIQRFRKNPWNAREVTISQAVFEGVLRITDIASFWDAFCNGFGPAKAYGCGLITIAPYKYITK